MLFTSNIGILPQIKTKHPILGFSGGPNFNGGCPMLAIYLNTFTGEGYIGITYVTPYVSKERIESIKKRVIEIVKKEL